MATASREPAQPGRSDLRDADAQRADSRGDRRSHGSAGSPGDWFTAGRVGGGPAVRPDPFCIRQNDRVLLETSMMLWVLLGYLVFLSVIGRSPSRWLWIRAVGAGLLFGLAVLTKDEATLLTVFPLLVAALLRWGARRVLTLLTACITVCVYAAYVAVAAINGHIGPWLDAKTSGIQRILGLVRVTGFNHAGTPSIYSVLLGEQLLRHDIPVADLGCASAVRRACAWRSVATDAGATVGRGRGDARLRLLPRHPRGAGTLPSGYPKPAIAARGSDAPVRPGSARRSRPGHSGGASRGGRSSSPDWCSPSASTRPPGSSGGCGPTMDMRCYFDT